MPYLHCPSCRLATFSAAADPAASECPRCGAELTPRPRPLFGPMSGDDVRSPLFGGAAADEPPVDQTAA